MLALVVATAAVTGTTIAAIGLPRRTLTGTSAILPTMVPTAAATLIGNVVIAPVHPLLGPLLALIGLAHAGATGALAARRLGRLGHGILGGTALAGGRHLLQLE